MAKGIRTENNVYVLKENREECHLRKHDESWLWHRRLGHINFDHLIKLKNLEAVKDLLKISKPQDLVCKPCQAGKQNRTQFKSKRFTSTEKPLQLVHMDLCGSSRHKGTGKENYFMLIIDDYSRLTWVAFLKEKDEAFEKFKIFKALTETQIGKRLKQYGLTEEESSVLEALKNSVIKMGSKENTQFQGLHSKTELLRGRTGQYSKWQDQ